MGYVEFKNQVGSRASGHPTKIYRLIKQCICQACDNAPSRRKEGGALQQKTF